MHVVCYCLHMTFYRIQTNDRDAADLLDPANHISISWFASEDYDREGVSVCESVEALAFYLANSGIPYGIGEWVIVEVDGDVIADGDPMDAKFGELLIRPTRIVSIRPMDDEFFGMIGAAYDAMGE